MGIFEKIWTWLADIFDAQIWLIGQLWRIVWSATALFWSLALGLLAIAVWLSSQVYDAILLLLGWVESLMIPGQQGTVSGVTSLMAFANYFVPLEEVMGMLALYFALVNVLTAYRFVKSWIPGVS